MQRKTYPSIRSGLAFCLALLVGFAVGMPVSHASVITQESFTQAAGTNLNGQTSGVGWSGNWERSDGDGAKIAETQSGNLDFGSLVTTGNSATVGNRSRLFRSIDPAAYPTALIDNNQIGGNGQSAYLSFTQASNELGEFFALRIARNGSVGDRVLGIGDTQVNSNLSASLNNGNEVTNLSSADTNVHFYVVRFDFDDANGDTIEVFQDPSLSSEPGSADATFSGGDFAFDTISIEAFDGSQSPTSFRTFADEIRIGETYADVTPVPEPASLVMGLLGFGALALRRKRAA